MGAVFSLDAYFSFISAACRPNSEKSCVLLLLHPPIFLSFVGVVFRCALLNAASAPHRIRKSIVARLYPTCSAFFTYFHVAMQFGFASRAIVVLVVSLSLVSQNSFGA